MIETLLGGARGAWGALVQRGDGIAMFATGGPLYERLGYRTVVEYDGYADPAASADH